MHRPPHVHSLAAAEEAAELYAHYRYPLDDEQYRTLEGGMGERADGSWAAGEVGDFKGRQAGKNDAVEAREFYGIHPELGGEQLVIHTAHEFPTANEAFLRMVPLWENWDDLRKLVKRIRFANGEQGIDLLSGARLKYRARTGGSGRGFAKADLVVYDEAQHLLPEHVAASAATILANPNAQLWLQGSGGLSISSVAWNMRRRAVRGDAGRLSYTELTAERYLIGPDGKVEFSLPDIVDPLDHDLLMAIHPGYAAGRVTRENLETLLGVLGHQLFIREVLCVWDPEPDDTGGGPISLSRWVELTDGESAPVDGTERVALDVSPDRRFACFGLAGKRSDNLHHVEVRDHRSNTAWVLERGEELSRGHRTPLIIDPGSPAGAFIDLFRERGVEVDEVTPRELSAACGRLVDAVDAGTVRHFDDPRVRAALAGATVRPLGESWAWSRRNSSVDISSLVALTLAFGRTAAMKTPEPFVVYA